MDDNHDRVVGDLRIEIDRDLCVGFGDCVTETPGAFRLDEENVAVFDNPENIDRVMLLKACEACPVDALSVWKTGGQQLVP